jgi:nucleoside-diphosphate-sugar epimerase
MSRIFLAGAAGVVGGRLTPLLLAQGHRVWGSTRSPDKSEVLRKLGALPVAVDVFDAEAPATAVLEAKPEIVIHQLTDLSAIQDPAKWSDALARNARIREQGTHHLVAAARKAGARRLIAQSIAWAYAGGPRPYGEDHPLDLNADGDRAVSVRGVESRRVAYGRAGVALWPAVRPGQSSSCAPEPALGPCRCSGPRRPPCSRSIMAGQAFSTSPTSMTRCRP